MTIYLVRWPHAQACLVRARDEDELRLILDEVADPTHARWTVYNGPFWIDVKLPVAPTPEGDLPAVDAGAIVAQGEQALTLSFGETEAGEAMREVVARWSLPHLHEVIETMNEEAAAEPDDLSPRRATARARHWRDRIERALEADEAEMTLFIHRQLEREARRQGASQRFRQEEMRAAVDRLAETLTRRFASARPALTLVRNDDDER